MKKLFLTLIILSLLLSACTVGKAPESSESKDLSCDSMASSAIDATSEETMEETTENTVDETTEETTEDTTVESEEPSEESREEVRPLAEITEEIASVKNGEFNTNIKDCEALTKLKEYLADSGYGFFYCDLEYNAFVSYGCDKDFKTASTAKQPYIKYLCTLADKGEIDINATMVYERRHYTVGSGIMKNMSQGTSFSVATLMDYVLRYSDNIAYGMLMERFGLKGYLESVKALGVDYTTVNGYTNCTAAEMAALLYDTALYNGANLSLMKNAGCNASYNYQIGAELKEYDVLQKYGAIKPGNVAYHDIAVVYAPHPYIIVMYTTIDYDSVGKNIPFHNIARLTDDLNKVLYQDA